MHLLLLRVKVEMWDLTKWRGHLWGEYQRKKGEGVVENNRFDRVTVFLGMGLHIFRIPVWHQVPDLSLQSMHLAAMLLMSDHMATRCLRT